MTEQELIDGIAKEGATAYFEMWDNLFEEQKNNWRQWAEDRILPIIKKAGYLPCEEPKENKEE